MWSFRPKCPIVVVGGKSIGISVGGLRVSKSSSSKQSIPTSSKPARSSGERISKGDGGCCSSESGGCNGDNVVESAGEIPALPRGESPFAICMQLGENVCPVAHEDTAVTLLALGDNVAVGESDGTVLITGYCSSSGRVFFRFRFVLLLLLLPVAGLGLEGPCDLFIAFVLGRAAEKCCIIAGPPPPWISTVGGEVAGGDAMLASGDFCPSGGDVGAGTALGELQPSDQSVSNSTMSWWCLSLAISSGVMSMLSASLRFA